MSNSSDSTLPFDEVLEKFNIKVISPLGGRLNQHWLVNFKNERLVLRLWYKPTHIDDIDYEVNLLKWISGLGWPVATSGIGQRKDWRRCEEILFDYELDRLLSENERQQPEEIRILRWHLERARKRVEGLQLHSRPGIVIHGDFTPWNLRFQEGKLSGILDFELAHWDHRVGDFALSWRGKYDEVIYGYDEVSPLEFVEWELLTPMWWAGLIENACKHLKEGTRDDGWIIKKLLERSPLMGQEAVPFR